MFSTVTSLLPVLSNYLCRSFHITLFFSQKLTVFTWQEFELAWQVPFEINLFQATEVYRYSNFGLTAYLSS